MQITAAEARLRARGVDEVAIAVVEPNALARRFGGRPGRAPPLVTDMRPIDGDAGPRPTT